MNGVLLRRIALLCASISVSLVFSLLIVTASMENHEIEQHRLPHRISCTSICVNRVVSYDGPFYEDGTGREVLDIAALEICNQGDVVIPYACIIVKTEKREYLFQATMIPVDTPVLVQESHAQPYFTEEIVNIFGWNTVRKCSKTYDISIKETGIAELTLKNNSADRAENLTVYYRTYYSEGNVYCGGKAFSVKIPPIEPGETKKLHPEYYVSGYSRIVNIISEPWTGNPADGDAGDYQK